MSDLYGGLNTDDYDLEKAGLPVGVAKYMAISEETDAKGHLVVNYECVAGPNKGRSGKVWYCLSHTNEKTANIAKQSLKRIADATGRPVSAQTPIKGRVLTLDVREQKKDPRYTEVFRYLPEGHKEEEKAPF